MSVSLDLRSFRNPADRARKMADYKEYLKLQQKLNRNAEMANKAYAKGQTLGIQPSGPSRRYSSAEEAQADVATQRETALRNLREVLPYGSDALDFLNQYIDATTTIGARGSELSAFNSSFADFKSELKGQTNITPAFLNQIWERYKVKLGKTNMTGINIPIDSTEFTANLRRLGNQIKTTAKETRTFTSTQMGKLARAVDTFIEGRNADQLEVILKALESGNERVIDAVMENVETASTTTGTFLSRIPKAQMSTSQLKKYLQELLTDKYPGGWKSREPFTFGDFTGTISKLDNEKGKDGLMAAVSYWENVIIPSPGEEAGSPARTTLRRSLSSPDLKGKGLRRRVIVGNGLKPQQPERYKQFGRYVIHMPSLKKNNLNLKFPSLGYNYDLPITHISDDMKEFIYDLLETERITPKLYNKLTKEEKAMFERVAEKAQLDEVLGIKVENLEQKEAMKRFEILRGELIAGNDNPEMIKELKKYLLQFMNEGLIPRKEGQSILIELACM